MAMHPFLNIAIRAARAGGDVVFRHHNQISRLTIESKAANDFVSEVDRYSEQAIINEIRKSYPNHSFICEEGGEISGDQNFQWVIDPLDGTTNFLHGFPQYAISIALFEKSVLTHSVVYDPFKEELFNASRGGGAFLNNKRLRIAHKTGLQNTLIGTGFPFKQPQHLPCYLKTFTAIHRQVAGIRRAGSAALDLAYVAASRLDGFWEIGLDKWDIAGGILLIEEAGGFVSDFSGEKRYFDSGNVVAGGVNIHQTILASIQPHLTKKLAY